MGALGGVEVIKRTVAMTQCGGGGFFCPEHIALFPKNVEQQGGKNRSLPLFTCGEADRSRHGKCCSSCCCCCCWGDHFHFTSLMYTQKGCEKKNLCQKVGVKKENFS